jgi:hypothetical protein
VILCERGIRTFPQHRPHQPDRFDEHGSGRRRSRWNDRRGSS